MKKGREHKRFFFFRVFYDRRMIKKERKRRMLSAMDEWGKLLFLGKVDKKMYEKLKKQKWFCPACKEKVILKNGQIKQAHFAHQSLNHCDCFSESESEEHLAGKLLLAQWCERYQLPYEIEAYLPQLNQRPDLLIDGHYAIEFQCSPLSIKRFCERTQTYRKYGYQVVWIVGEKFHLKTSSTISELQRHFFMLDERMGFYLWQLSVQQATLDCLIKIEESDSNHLCWFMKRWEPKIDSPEQWLSFLENNQFFPMRVYDGEKQSKKIYQRMMRGLHFQQPTLLKLQQQLYEKGQHLLLLDPIYYSFLPGMWFIAGELIEWLLYWWETVQKEETVSGITAAFRHAIEHGLIKMYSLVQSSIDQYLHYFLNEWHRLLEQLCYIERHEDQLFVLREPMPCASFQEVQEKMQTCWQEQQQISASFLRSMVR